MLTKSSLSPFRALRYVHALFRWAIIILVVGIILNARVITVFRVDGVSMEPTYHDGNYLVVCKVCSALDPLVVDDIVVLQYEADHNLRLVKRLAGLPESTILVEDKSYNLKTDQYFVLGDNREHSVDSRDYGPVKGENIVGTVLLKVGK